MDEREIDSVLTAKGLYGNPAYDNLIFLIEPIPRMDGCPLGLYFSGTKAVIDPSGAFYRMYDDPQWGTIILPPDADVSTLLHEVGHRYNDYYRHDLSESAAEQFREKYDTSPRRFILARGGYLECADCHARMAVTGDEISCPKCGARYRRFGLKGG
jgi:hypothetical protein